MFEPAGELPPISSGVRRLLTLLAELPLATAGEIAGLSSFGSTRVCTRLGELREADWLRCPDSEV